MPKSTKTSSQSGRSSMGQVQSLMRGLAILENLADAPAGLNLTDIAENVGLPPSTAHRLLNSLLQKQFVIQDELRGTWTIGVGAFSVGNTYLKSRDFVTVARPFMRELVHQTGETSNLAILENDVPVFVAQIECNEMMRMVARLGSHAPLHASGVGKSLLSVMPDKQVRSLIKSAGLYTFNEYTLKSVPELLRELATIRKQGYAVDNEEQSVGLRCIASNIFNEHQEPVAAISISGPVQRVTEDRISELGELVRGKALEITYCLGGKDSVH